MNDYDSLFKRFMLNFITELKVCYGFKIPLDRILDIFKVYGKYDFFDEEEVKNLLCSLLCQKQEEILIFNQAFYAYFGWAKKIAVDGMSDYYIDNILAALNEQKEELKEEQILTDSEFAKTVNEIEKADEEMTKNLMYIASRINSADVTVLFNVLIKDGAQLYQICTINSSQKNGVINRLEQEIQKSLIFSIDENMGEDVSAAIIDAAETFSKYLKEFQEIKTEHKEKVDKVEKEIVKYESKRHRETYIEGHNAVQAEKGYLFKDFSKLTENDLDKISGYIKRNAVSIKTKLHKAIKKKKQSKLDYKKTMKKAAKTNMLPMELLFKKQKRDKIKIVCITDISGSCKNASQILMTFIYALQEAFPGGVESYVFVKQLKDATEVFRNYSLKEANERTSVLVERNYSDYYSAFKQFDDEYFDRLTKDTIVIYLGDARNNKNQTGTEYLEKIRKKVTAGRGKMYWLNPEPSFEWKKGDSVMEIYKKYMDKTISVQNTADLIKFLDIMF